MLWYAPLVPSSVITGEGLERALDLVAEAAEWRQVRVPHRRLNELFQANELALAIATTAAPLAPHPTRCVSLTVGSTSSSSARSSFVRCPRSARSRTRRRGASASCTYCRRGRRYPRSSSTSTGRSSSTSPTGGGSRTPFVRSGPSRQRLCVSSSARGTFASEGAIARRPDEGRHAANGRVRAATRVSLPSSLRSDWRSGGRACWTARDDRSQDLRLTSLYNHTGWRLRKRSTCWWNT